MGIEFSKRAVIRVIMDAMAGLDSLKDIYDKVEAMEEPSQPELEVPAEIRDWFVKTLGDKQKFNGREVLEILQEVSEEDEGLNYRSFYNVNGNIAYYALENADIFLKLLVNCSKINGYTVKKEQLYYVVLKNTTQTNSNHCYLWINQATKKVFFDLKNKKWTNYGNVKNTFTEQEIAEISDGVLVDNKAFEAVPVEEE